MDKKDSDDSRRTIESAIRMYLLYIELKRTNDNSRLGKIVAPFQTLFLQPVSVEIVRLIRETDVVGSNFGNVKRLKFWVFKEPEEGRKRVDPRLHHRDSELRTWDITIHTYLLRETTSVLHRLPSTSTPLYIDSPSHRLPFPSTLLVY